METSLDRLRAAQQVVDQLKSELDAVDVILPSLGVDLLTLAGRGPESPYPLVDLGRCNMDTALRLAAVLSEGRR
ncbi:hypothetical protein [Streptomyces sp.]|uniref:hypothetical protein n=1 Tax=Streptomyces sp. TaxID=1931 RepID=UPI002F922078